ncbi:ARM repeat-containing protein [Microthyrium microscopicum]|uniref:ARM repeat-containing protein n=1 Tax=Microthyrium microscopicum TaxID=703497 RepID=A0A6A6U5D5_9PEZI|nr:ARM repeat-containing protein [Microthyrium microscopicum]
MSVLPPEVHSALNAILVGLQSPDNVIRSQAETRLADDWQTPRPEILLMGLAEQMMGSDDVGTRAFAAVMFRRAATKARKDPQSDQSKDTFWVLPDPQKVAIREKLLEALGTDNTPNVRNKVADAVAEIARQYTDEGITWQELLQALFNASQSAEVTQREIAFRIFASTPRIIETQHETVVQEAFTKGFKDPETSVRLAALQAFASFFGSLGRKAQTKYYNLVADILNVLPPLKEAGDSEELTKALTALIELAESAPKMFKGYFNSLVSFSVTVIQDKELSDICRQNALELMATFADSNPSMCRTDPSYTNEMVTQCLSLMTDVGIDDDDASEWASTEDLEVDESDANHVAGEQTLDRLANRLGGKTLLTPTFNWLPRMMTSSSWRDRHAALMAISAISEGCKELMLGELDKVLDLVTPALRDPHPRVRWAGCNALGQMSTDFAGAMQENYHQVVLPNIIPVLDSPEPRVQAHAAAALVNFCEEAEKTILEPYLDSLLENLLHLLRSPKRFVQEQALSTIATVADSAEEAFGKYYDTLMPLLFNVLNEEQAKEYRLLRAKALECTTLIALAVGKERMGNDAVALVQLLGTIQQNIVDDDDPQASYLLHCWGRMCRVLEQDFVPYLPAVIPRLTEMASAKADIQLVDEEKIAQLQEEDGWELVPLKGKMLGIKTSTLDDKHTAIELIIVYSQVLEASFSPYVIDIMDKIALPGLAFYFHDPVRVASAHCVSALLSSFKKAHGGESTDLGLLWGRVLEKLLESFGQEPAMDTLAGMYECFYECAQCMGKNCLTGDHMQKFVHATNGVLNEYIGRVEARTLEARERDDGDEPDEDTQFAIEDDQTLLSEMNKAFHAIFKNMSSAFLPHWDPLLNTTVLFAQSDDPTQRQWAICVFDDIIEFCGPQSANYQQQIMEPLVLGIRDDFSNNRQAAAYGIGVAASKGGPAWHPFLTQSLPLLFQCIQRPNARDEDDVYATENACAAIAKILHFAPSTVQNLQDVTTAWIDTLPIIHDEEAAPYGYSFLAQLIEQQNPAVISQAAKCFTYITQALVEQTLTEGATTERIIAMAKQLIATTGADAAGILASLPPDAQELVRQRFA